MRTFLATVIVLALWLPDEGQDQSRAPQASVAERLAVVETWIDAQLAWEQIPGMSVALVHDQQVVWSKGFGWADVERRRPAAPDTIYSICSISKLFTSTAVMQLRDRGKLSLDAPVAEYLPWMQIRQRFPDGPQITLRGILTHSAGLPREADFPYWTGPDYPFPPREQVIEALRGQETLYQSFSEYQYSNLGMTLAGEVVAAVSGQPYAEYVQANILSPLGLGSTTPEIPADQQDRRLARGYSGRLRDGHREPIGFYTVNGIAPAAGYASTVEDLAALASWQFRLLRTSGEEVLDANTLREMQRVQWLSEDWSTGRGLGFSVSRRSGRTFVGHGGSCPGYRSDLLLSMDDRIAVVAMTNGHDVNPGTYSRGIFDLLRPALVRAEEEEENAPAKDDSALRRYTGRYDRPLGGETHVFVVDGELMTLSMPTDDPAGGLTRLKPDGEHTFRRVRDDGKLAETVTFELGPDGQVNRMVRNSNYSIRVR
jgi:CubicO group peptidase (beta-lactamase class C family)